MKYIIAALLSAGLWACDPMRRINMINQSGGKVEITWLLKDMDSLYKSPFFISNSRTVRFDLKPQQPYNRVQMSFGVGTWPLDTLATITNRLESLEIRSAGGTIKLASDKEIYSFLASRRKGLRHRKIDILIKK